MSVRTTGVIALVIALVALSPACQRTADHPWENRVARADLPTRGPGPCWEITYDRLLLRPLCAGPVKASFPVLRHFDVARTYDFGESVQPLSFSEERPWKERAFLEVDWSRNLETTGVRTSPWALAVGLLGLVGVALGIGWTRRHR